MAGNLRRFINPRFIKTIDLGLMKRLLRRHGPDLAGAALDELDGDGPAARQALAELLTGPQESCPKGLRADLHRIAELGDARGLEIIQAQAHRYGIDLFPELRTADDGAPNPAHDPKHIALRVFLEHPALFDGAADHRAMMTADRLHELAGPERGVRADLADEKMEEFRARVAELFRDAFLGDYCRVAAHVDDDETSLVVAHGTPVSTMPVVEGQRERVISVRRITHAILRYSDATGILGLARIRKAQRAAVAELFASILLGRPGFFAGEAAHALYTLAPVERAGPGFAFEHSYDPQIDRVRIIEAAGDLLVAGRDGTLRVARSLRSVDPAGGALRHLAETSADFSGAWRLAELVFRVVFRSDARDGAQVTVRIGPPGTLQFRRTRHEARILRLLDRNGLVHDRDAPVGAVAAE